MAPRSENRQSAEPDSNQGRKRRRESTPWHELRPTFPPYTGGNVIDWHIYNRLGKIWNNEHRSWTISEKLDFVIWVKEATVTETTCVIGAHPLSQRLESIRPSWGHFVVLRAMFGASACSRQPWWEEFKSRYLGATHDAPPGVVPRKDYIDAIRDNVMDIPSNVPIPIVGHCRRPEEDNELASSPLRGAAAEKQKAERNIRGIPVSNEEAQAEIEIIEAINLDVAEDPKRFDREQGVEPGASETDPEWSEFMAGTEVAKTKGKRNAEAIKKLKTHVRKQDELINELVELVREQQDKMEVMDARMESMAEMQRGNEEWHKCVDGRMRALRKRIERR
ncbi:hypothetical protein PT974_02146 [Cladobotryum mycophilum]|uniref:Uncharacterized protein n=1 Tax=Cladobotryum mycophilum TaxID=491253 RepID=A0ABR0SXB5_9HYPO